MSLINKNLLLLLGVVSYFIMIFVLLYLKSKYIGKMYTTNLFLNLIITVTVISGGIMIFFLIKNP